MGCGSSVTSREPVLASTGSGVNVPFHPELIELKSDDITEMDISTEMKSPITPGRSMAVVCSVCGVPEDAIPLQLRNDMYYCDNCNHDSEANFTDEDDVLPPHSMMEKALSYRPHMTMEGCEAILSRYLRRYPAYMAENDQMEIIDIEACRVTSLGMSCEEMTVFSTDVLTNSTRGEQSWRSHSESQSESGRGSALHFNRPATPSGVVTSEPSHVSQFVRRTLTSFKARMAFSDDGSPTDAEAEAAPKYLLSPIKESIMVLSDDEGSGNLSPRVVTSPLSKSLTPRRAAVQDAIATFRKERDKDLSESQQKIFERVRAWSELNLIFLLGTPPSEVTSPLGRSVASNGISTSDSPGPSGRRKPKKLHLSSSTLHTLQLFIRNKGAVEGGTPRQPSHEEDPITSLAEVVTWYYGTAPLGMPSSSLTTPSHQELADLYPPCLLEHMHHPVYGYALEHHAHNTNAFKCISVTLARITREFNAQACPADIVITTY